jgi:hypothetical protein
MNLRHGVMVAGLLVGAWFAFMADKTPEDDTIVASRSPEHDSVGQAASEKPTRRDNGGATDDAAAKSLLRLHERPAYVRRLAESVAEGPIFVSGSWVPPPPPPGPPPPEVAPPLPYTYLGKKLENGVWEVYLALGDQVRIVRPKTLLDDKYRIDAIAPPELRLTYLPLQQQQILNIGVPQ